MSISAKLAAGGQSHLRLADALHALQRFKRENLPLHGLAPAARCIRAQHQYASLSHRHPLLLPIVLHCCGVCADADCNASCTVDAAVNVVEGGADGYVQRASAAMKAVTHSPVLLGLVFLLCNIYNSLLATFSGDAQEEPELSC